MTNWPADKVERRSIDALIPYARNARTHTDTQVAQIAASIREWGWTVPVLVDEDGGIIAGHGRIMAARKLGLSDVPVMVASGWSDAQKKAYVLADNKLALNAGWDLEMLGGELRELSEMGFDCDLTGFDGSELESLMAERTEGLTDPDDVPEPPVEPVTRLGDVWVMVTDPPYGVEYDASWRAKVGVNKNKGKMGVVSNDDRADWLEAWVLFPGDVAYVWHGALHAATVADSLEAAGFNVRSQIIWAKDRLVLSRGDYHWQHEPCWYAVKKTGKGHWAGDRKQTTVWRINARDDSGHGHSTQKPVECMKRPIENNSSPGQAVYEPFSGSGTTIIAGEMTGRSIHAIELSPAYVDVAVKRWQDFTGKQAVLEGDGRTFNEIGQRGAS